MILDIILGWITGLLNGVAGKWPDHTWEGVNSEPVARFLDDINYLLPIGEIFALTFAVLLLGVPLVVTSLFLYVVAFIRGGSSRG